MSEAQVFCECPLTVLLWVAEPQHCETLVQHIRTLCDSPSCLIDGAERKFQTDVRDPVIRLQRAVHDPCYVRLQFKAHYRTRFVPQLSENELLSNLLQACARLPFAVGGCKGPLPPDTALPDEPPPGDSVADGQESQPPQQPAPEEAEEQLSETEEQPWRQVAPAALVLAAMLLFGAKA
jgi:hypothetical protein